MSATRRLASHGVLSGTAANSHRIIALLERMLTLSDPTPGLANLTELRRELDELERVYVARALQSGSSFATVARPLGITRQAAHRRFRDLAVPPPARPCLPRLSPDARSALVRARDEAKRHGSVSIDSTHVLLGVACQRSLEVDLEAARRWFGPPVINASAPTGLDPALHARLTREAGPVRIDHLVRAALQDPGGQRLLNRLGIPPKRLLCPSA